MLLSATKSRRVFSLPHSLIFVLWRILLRCTVSPVVTWTSLTPVSLSPVSPAPLHRMHSWTTRLPRPATGRRSPPSSLIPTKTASWSHVGTNQNNSPSARVPLETVGPSSRFSTTPISNPSPICSNRCSHLCISRKSRKLNLSKQSNTPPNGTNIVLSTPATTSHSPRRSASSTEEAPAAASRTV
jgi:hypothetical protein